MERREGGEAPGPTAKGPRRSGLPGPPRAARWGKAAGVAMHTEGLAAGRRG
jgi:hypothetical protein